jgi:hypothetical protein
LASWTAANIDFRVKRVAPVSVEGDFATTFMEYTSSAADGTQVGVYQFEKGKILRFWFFKLGSDPPFDNAVLDPTLPCTLSVTRVGYSGGSCIGPLLRRNRLKHLSPCVGPPTSL